MATGTAPKEFLLSLSFITAFGVFIASLYGLGREDENKEGVGYRTASTFVTISIFAMIITWFLRWGMNLPGDVSGFSQAWYNYTGIPKPN